MKTVRRPPYPKWNPGYFPCSSLTPPSAFLTPSIGVLRRIRFKRAYERKYLGSESVIRKKKHRTRLALLTTTSALGRSSIYNRLSLPGGPLFLRIGTTRGFGHFHLSGEIFAALRGHLEATGHPYASGHRFGMGPNWKLRVARAALEGIGIDGNSILKHGIEREVYAILTCPQ